MERPRLELQVTARMPLKVKGKSLKLEKVREINNREPTPSPHRYRRRL